MKIRSACIAASLTLACGGTQTPVPVVGTSADISQLAGEWTGDYSSVESGRSGSIVFKLVAGSDTASGDVFMTPRWNTLPGNVAQATPQPVAMPPLTIRFVRIQRGQVSGVLAPYQEPTCGCTLHTTFVGRLQSDTLSGTYTSLDEQTGQTQHGRWRAVRSRS